MRKKIHVLCLLTFLLALCMAMTANAEEKTTVTLLVPAEGETVPSAGEKEETGSSVGKKEETAPESRAKGEAAGRKTEQMSKKTADKTPKTGDDANIIWLSAVMAVAGCFLLLEKRRIKKS